MDATPTVLAAPEPTDGVSLELRDPMSHPCEFAPTLVQLSPWLGAGAGWRARSLIPSFSAGADATVAVATLFQPPGGDNGGKISVRIGPWAAAETPLDRVRVEGGLSLALRQERFEAWGTLGLRAGGGVDTGGVAHWVGTVSWGLYGERVEEHSCSGLPLLDAHSLAVTDGIRLFASLRREVPGDVNEWTFGIELQPEWFLPLPQGYGYQRWRRH